MLIKEAAQLTFAHAEAFGEPLDGGARTVERALCNAGHGAADGACGAAPRGRVRGNLRAAAEAGAKAGLLCGGGGGEKAAVVAQGSAGRADGAAVDARGGDANEEAAIEADIARLQRAIADVRIQQNGIE